MAADPSVDGGCLISTTESSRIWVQIPEGGIMKEAENSSLKWKWGMGMKKKILICALICTIGAATTLSLVMNQYNEPIN